MGERNETIPAAQNPTNKPNTFREQSQSATKVIPPWAVDVPETRRTHFASTPHIHQASNGRSEIRTRAPLISLYRGEAPQRSKSQNEINRASRPPHGGGLFQVHTSTRRAPYYVIHPEWLSEAMTIRQLELSPRPSAPTSLIGLPNSRKTLEARSNWSNQSKQLNPTNPHSESKSAPVTRCRSMPSKPLNPITWEP
ncbi:unnamed protein product [Echinostoma caproni]|uniref:BRCT domain-containing protein n=1 Tax=Echinostoma caproni TaxID=27848 RepID=A0A183AVD0_9TREM|nr:unnamed protein product [Echinostoma caproni]